jgi:hypothetical protein
MRLLIGFLLVLTALAYFQSERHDCSIRWISAENWLLCVQVSGTPQSDFLFPAASSLTLTVATCRTNARSTPALTALV